MRPKFLAASEKRLTMCCKSSSVWARRAQSSANSSSISDEFLDGFRACEETPKVEDTAVCSETDVDAVWQVVFCLTEHDAEEDGEHCGGQNASLLDAVEDGEAAQQRPIVLHLTSVSYTHLTLPTTRMV